MKATTSITNSNLILLLFCVLCLQIITATRDCPRGQLKHGDKCCRPVLHCPAGSYVKTCERNGNCDECLPCTRGTKNPFITSSFDVKKCYKNDCPTDAFRVSGIKCECALHDGYVGENSHFCQISPLECAKGKELTHEGKCEDCENNHYKYWVGKGYCIRDVDCSMIGLNKTAGNLATPTICLGLEDKCSPKERKPPLPPDVRPQTPTTVRVSSSATTTTTTTTPSVPVATTVRRTATKRLLTKRTEESKPTAFIPPVTEKSESVSMEGRRTSTLRSNRNDFDVFRAQYIYATVIGVLIIIVIILIAYIVRIKHQSRKKQKRHDNNYQSIDQVRKVSPNDTQRPLPKKPSSSNLIDTYMEMGKSGSTLKSSVPYFISSPYDPSTLTRLIQPPGVEIPILPPIYQQTTQSMMGFRHCSPPRQESNASGEELGLGSSSSIRDCSISSETALKVPDATEPNSNRFDAATMTEATRAELAAVDPVRVEPFRRDFEPSYQDAISLHSTSQYSPAFHCIQQPQVTQTGIVLPQFVHYTQPMNKTRNREYV
ncbi:uncharacterized protein LOC115224755 [Octopus sinensis]|uniref:Uncharacterized protein LOC115224755 n=1 Tax=Octopus sinensis TaxID=2607531 RepID=A0A6P7TNJ3_9MOLL|nr:uncharacterized protein LOC115224755 [Octopus sinensis]